MKKIAILRFLTAVGSGLSALAALDLTGVSHFFDPAVAAYLLAAGPVALTLKELVVSIGDWIDDGKLNKSFKIGLFCFCVAVLTLPFLASCSAPPGVTGEFISKDGKFIVRPDGRVEIVVEPRTSK